MYQSESLTDVVEINTRLDIMDAPSVNRIDPLKKKMIFIRVRFCWKQRVEREVSKPKPLP